MFGGQSFQVSSNQEQAVEAQALTIVGQPPVSKIHHDAGRETTSTRQ
jgi:hypothetical protein